MANWRVLRIRSDIDLADMLNGAVASAVDIQNGVNIDGLTLVIDAGAGSKTVTFAPAKGRLWTPEEIVAQIAAADVSLANIPKIRRAAIAVRGGTPTYLKLFKDATTTITLKSTGTANSLFGWSIVVDTVGEPFTEDDVYSRIDYHDQHWYVVVYK